MKVFLAVNPETKVPSYLLILKEFDGILFMGVHPGKEHQKLINSVYKKIKQIRKINKKIAIQIDGGVSSDNIKNLAKAGVNLFNTGSFVSESAHPREMILKLKKELKS